MSYILDALKRADTERERERGRVPGLHSQNLPGGVQMRERERKRKAAGNQKRWVLAGVGAIGLAVLLGYGWYHTTTQAPQLAAEQPAPDAPLSPVIVSPVPAIETAPPTADATAAATPTPPDLPILGPAPPKPAPAPAPPPTARQGEATANAAPAGPAPASAAATAPTPQTPVQRFAELPAEFRARLPQVNISGSTYSSNPAQRTLIANGKMVQEGEEVAPGLELVTIGQRSAVLSYQGTRYSIGY